MSGPVPVISATGITAGSFSDWLTYLQTQYQAIYGADTYLGNDSQDGQFLGILAKALSDCCAAAVSVYNSFSPATAQGAGLSSVVKINGLQRLTPSFSVVNLTITGTSGTTIANGQAQDANGNLWSLPLSVTIPNVGSIVVTATAVTAGAIAAPAGTINTIATPVYGWQSVTNTSDAVAGSPIETDAQLRARQSVSTSLPSLTIFEGVISAIMNLPGVTRARGYENNTSSVDANGIPANSLAFFVEGGVQAAIQNAIFSKCTPGIPTVGSISAIIADSVGSTRPVAYSVPTPATISAQVTIKGLTGWSTAIEPVIAQAIASYVNNLPIGENVSYTGMIVAAYLLGTTYAGTYNIVAMTIAKNAGPASAADQALTYSEAPVCNASNITFTVL